PSASAATNVVICNPSGGLVTIASLSPPLVDNVSPDASYGLQFESQFDGCTANAAQLAAWAPAKLGGTPNGALTARADVKLKAKGFGTCDFTTPDAGNYLPSGKLQVKWLDAAGRGVPMTTPSSAYVRVSANIAAATLNADGIVTKGLGMGANIHGSLG